MSHFLFIYDLISSQVRNTLFLFLNMLPGDYHLFITTFNSPLFPPLQKLRIFVLYVIFSGVTVSFHFHIHFVHSSDGHSLQLMIYEYLFVFFSSHMSFNLSVTLRIVHNKFSFSRFIPCFSLFGNKTVTSFLCRNIRGKVFSSLHIHVFFNLLSLIYIHGFIFIGFCFIFSHYGCSV